MPEPAPSSFTSVFRASDNQRVKRNRQPVSCIACQRRKTKCSRRVPCGACEKRGESASCKFGAASGAGGSSSSSSRLETQARLSRLEQLVRDLAPGGADESAGRRGARVGAGMSGDDVCEGLEDDQYRGATCWTAVVDSIHDLQRFLEVREEFESPDQVPASEPDIVLGNVPPITIKDIVDSLPSRSNADQLLSLYFNAKFQCFPFLHTHQFRRQYEAFRNDPSSSGYLWISILFSVLSSAVLVARVKGPSSKALPSSLTEQQAYLIRSAQCLVAGEYHRARPLSVEALLAHALARNLQKQDSNSNNWSLFGLAIRLAQRRGYHRDTSKIAVSVTPFEDEMRRRTWFVVQTTDLLFSFQHGLPGMIYEDVCDVGLPTNITHEDFDEDSIILPQPRPPTDASPSLLYIVKSQLCHILRRVIRYALAVEPPTHQQTMAMNDELEQFYQSIPACLRIRPIRDTAFTDPNYAIMYRIVIEVTYRKALCVLHRPFLNAGNTSAECMNSREICRDAALRIVEMHIECDREIHPGGRMYEDRYMVSSLALHDFLIAAMILSLDLSEFPNIRSVIHSKCISQVASLTLGSPEDKENRIRSLRKAQAIWAARTKESPEARHASRILRGILAKVDPPRDSNGSPDPVTSASESFVNFAITNGPAAVGFDGGHAAQMPAPEDAAAVQQMPLIDLFGTSESVDWVRFRQ